MNPCPCGYLGHPVKPCRCTPESVARYRSKISGPLLDRIDLTIEVPSLSAAELMQQEAGESSASVLERVIAARGKQYARQGKVNAALSVSELDSQACIQKKRRKPWVACWKNCLFPPAASTALCAWRVHWRIWRAMKKSAEATS